jgi:ketosteroid isomerase-like protein
MTNLRKKTPYRAALAAMVVVLAVACSGPSVGVDVKVGVKDAQATLDSAMQADRDFAAAVKKDGPKAAFLAWFEPEGSQFIDRGSMLEGAAAIAAPFEQSPPGFTLDWAPDGGHASAGDDFAVTTGRYAVKMDAQQIDAGRYVTTWRKNAEGAWKVVLDATIADPLAVDPASAAPPAPDPDGRPG